MHRTRVGVIQHSKYRCHMSAWRRHTHKALCYATLSVKIP